MTSAGAQGTLEGMPERLFAATPSRLTTWLDCPRRYRFAYLDRPPPPKGPPWAHNSLGAAVHLALAAWWRAARHDRTVRAAGDLLETSWLSEGFRDERQSHTWRVRAREMVERYVARLDPDREPRGVERTVSVVAGRVALSGRVDRIDERGDELVVVDYKTGRRVLHADDARTSLALAVYAAAAERTLRRRCRRVELHHVPTGSVVAWEHTDESLRRHIGRAEALGRECAEAAHIYARVRPAALGHTGAAAGAGSTAAVAPASASASASALGSALGPSGWPVPDPELDREFPARTGPACAWCDFLTACAEGRATTRPRPSWDGLAGEAGTGSGAAATSTATPDAGGPEPGGSGSPANGPELGHRGRARPGGRT